MEEGLKQELTLEELNSLMYEAVPVMTEEEVDRAIENFYKAVAEKNKDNGGYYLLYGRSMSYFTILRLNMSVMEYNKEQRIDKVLKECLKNIGKIYDFETRIENDDVVCEIWVKKAGKTKSECLMLFNFDKGVENVWS